MEKWQKKIPGNMLIGIPNRDFLIAFSDRHNGREGIKRQIRRDFRRKEYGLTPNLLVWGNSLPPRKSGGRIREFQPKH